MSAARCCASAAHRPSRHWIAGWRCSATASTSSCSGSGAPMRTRTCAAAVELAARRGVPVVATNDVRFLTPEQFESHEARVCIHDGTLLADAARPRRYTAQQYLRSAAGDGARCLPICPRRSPTRVQIARRCSLVLKLGRRGCRTIRCPRAARPNDYLRARRSAGWTRGMVALRAAGRGGQPATARGSTAELDGDLPDGLRRLLPDRRRLHPLGARARRAGGAGPRLGRRLAGGLCAAHHRHRSAALRPAVRALPESRARLDAGLRHRFLHGGARPGDRLRGRQVRSRPRLADHHLRHHGRQGGGARRRPRAGSSVRLRRPHRQADPLRAGHHARRCDRQGGGAQAPLRAGRGGAQPARSGALARGPDAQRRQARRRRGDRPLGADRLHAAVLRARRHQSWSRSSTRTTSRRPAW